MAVTNRLAAAAGILFMAIYAPVDQSPLRAGQSTELQEVLAREALQFRHATLVQELRRTLRHTEPPRDLVEGHCGVRANRLVESVLRPRFRLIARTLWPSAELPVDPALLCLGHFALRLFRRVIR